VPGSYKTELASHQWNRTRFRTQCLDTDSVSILELTREQMAQQLDKQAMELPTRGGSHLSHLLERRSNGQRAIWGSVAGRRDSQHSPEEG
jgi:hypothetical protein